MHRSQATLQICCAMATKQKLIAFGTRFLRSSTNPGPSNTLWMWRACLRSECWFARWKAVPDVWLAVEAFASCSWGHGAGAGWWSRLANPHLKHGTHWQLARSTWICCFWRSMAVSGRSKTFARGFGTGPWSWWWMGRVVLPELQCVKHGASGNLAPSSGGTLARWRYHPWHEVARTRSTKPIVRSWDGWLTSPMVRLQDCPWPAAGVEPSLGMHAPTVSKGFAYIVTGTAPHGCAATSSMQQVEGVSPFHRFNLASLVVLFLASCMGQRYCHRRRGGVSVRCAGDGGEDLQPGWQAVDAMQRIETQRVQEWRKTHGLESDEDFAFAFVNWEQASVSAGSLVADSWVAARSAASDAMLHQVSESLPPVHLVPDLCSHVSKS